MGPLQAVIHVLDILHPLVIEPVFEGLGALFGVYRNALFPGGAPTEHARAIMWQLIRHTDSPPSRLIAIYAVGLGAFYGATSILAYYMNLRFGVTKETIGYFRRTL